jgi:hypothetical protein
MIENPAGAGAERKKGAFRGKAVLKLFINMERFILVE